MARFWYAYNGVGNPFEASNYERAESLIHPSCRTGTIVCAIYATGSISGLSPDEPFSSNLREYITLALTSQGVPIPDSGKRYIYMRN